MILIYLIIILLAGAFLSWIAGTKNSVWPRIITLVAVSTDLVISLVTLAGDAGNTDRWISDIKMEHPYQQFTLQEYVDAVHASLDRVVRHTAQIQKLVQQ